VKSTRAAAKHLKDLFKLYDDWNLVMAAYNCGAGRVNRSTQQSGLNDYWRIDLPKETDNYVPMYMAALIISKAPEIFGFQNIEKEPEYEYETVDVRPYTKIDAAARCAGVDVEVLKDLNAELIKDCAPRGTDMYQLKIPRWCKDKFLVEYAKLPEEKFKAQRSAKIYTVRSGDTVSKIARQHGISMSSLLASNRLKTTSVLKIGQKLKIPGAGDDEGIDESAENSSAAKTVVETKPGAKSQKYTVKKDDTLWSIAEKFNSTVDDLKQANKLHDSSELLAGQNIVVPVVLEKAVQSNKTPVKAALAARDSDYITYIVQANDSLYVIAQKHEVSYKDIMIWNKIRNPRLIKPGDKLVIKTKG
jgi:membrane-bound lytic murein transglycosylase D